jgi:hypothetical protein
MSDRGEPGREGSWPGIFGTGFGTPWPGVPDGAAPVPETTDSETADADRYVSLGSLYRCIAGLRPVQVGSSAVARLPDSHRLKAAVLQPR